MNKDNLGNTDVNLNEALPFSQACENNKDAILAVLHQELVGARHVLEVGSGTGQHSVYFAPHLPHINWQTSDVPSNHATINAWQRAYPAANVLAPLAFDLRCDTVPMSKNVSLSYDAVFTANTLHIIAWPLVERLFELVGGALPTKGKFIIYGPFNENGRYTSAGNQSFDKSLRARDSGSGIRDKQEVIDLARRHRLILKNQYAMPANNQILVFEKEA